jgi:splicing factor 3B subunit 3
MFVYNLTLSQTTQVHNQILGNFLGTKSQEILLNHGDSLQLVKIDPNLGKVVTILRQWGFGVIRDIKPFRLTGGSKDYIVVGSDSGKFSVLEYDTKLNRLVVVQEETFGKSGCRRVVPGQYLATDPKGRAVMIAALEKQKLVYIMNRDSATNLTVSSPLEAHKSHTILHSCVGVDVGFENPVFACLEVDYSEADQDHTGQAFHNAQKMLTYYELDLGLNHVVKKWSDPVDSKSNLLIALPGGSDGPSGVLVCSENWITYRHQGTPQHRVPIPHRQSPSPSSRGLIIISSALHKMKNSFFALVQSEVGDIYKVTIEHEQNTVKSINIKYFDTLPLATGFSILRSGFMLATCETGDHQLYQFESLGDGTDDTIWNSVDYPLGKKYPIVNFMPRELTNLALVDQVLNSSPSIHSQLHNLTEEDSPQIYSLCGRGNRSSFRIFRHGLEVTEMAVSPLPAHPSAVWTTKLNSESPHDAYIIVSFANATLVLSIGDTIEEVTDSGLLTTVPTIALQQIGPDGIVQIHSHGIRHIYGNGKVNEWNPPNQRIILHAATNHRQIAIALSGGEIMYFELDNTNTLVEFEETIQITSDVTALALGPIPEGRVRFPFLVVGSSDNTVRAFSLDPNAGLSQLSVQAVTANPSSLAILEMMDREHGAEYSTLYLHIGLTNGIMLRTVIDQVSGTLSDTRSRFLGSKSVKLVNISLQGSPAILALSSRPWLSYTHQSRTHTTPLSYEMLDSGSSFSSEQCPEGIVAIADNTLRIVSVEQLGGVFNQASIPLKYTPRRFVCHPESNNFAIGLSENHTYSKQELSRLLESENPGALALDPTAFGNPESDKPGKWASQILVVNPFDGETLSEIDLEENEAVFSMCNVQFYSDISTRYLVVGTAKSAILAPRSCSEASLNLYKWDANGTSLELVHRTPIDDFPMAITAFQGRLLAGVGKTLRIYDMGKKKMLRKCQYKLAPNMIVSLHTQGNRILVGDSQDSFFFTTYRPSDNQMVVFADDDTGAAVTCSYQLDYNTVAIGDKFGNIFINRTSEATSKEVDDDPTGNKLLFEKGYLGGAPHRTNRLVNFYVGDVVTSLQAISLVTGGREVIVYVTLMGKIGLLIPFMSKDDIEFFQTLEQHLRQEDNISLVGRSHFAYRSNSIPVKGCIDGDLCELYIHLPHNIRTQIAESLGRTPAEVAKKLEDIRNLSAF